MDDMKKLLFSLKMAKKFDVGLNAFVLVPSLWKVASTKIEVVAAIELAHPPIMEIKITKALEDIMWHLRELVQANHSQITFIIDGLNNENNIARVRNSVNIRREYIPDYAIKTVWFMNQEEFRYLANNAVDFFAFRHCVIDLID